LGAQCHRRNPKNDFAYLFQESIAEEMSVCKLQGMDYDDWMTRWYADQNFPRPNEKILRSAVMEVIQGRPTGSGDLIELLTKIKRLIQARSTGSMGPWDLPELWSKIKRALGVPENGGPWRVFLCTSTIYVGVNHAFGHFSATADMGTSPKLFGAVLFGRFEPRSWDER
jgi:hypothetical protein